MPRSTVPAIYGPEYEQLLLRAYDQGGLEITLESEKHATSFRGKVYSYFKALRTDGSRPDLIAKSQAISLTVEGRVFKAFPSADSWDAVAIREALGLQKQSSLTPPLATGAARTALQEKLLELRGLREKKEGGKE